MSNDEPSNIVQLDTLSGALTTPPWLTMKVALFIREVVAACGDDPRVNDHVVRNSWSMHQEKYFEWLKDLLAYYPPSRKELVFDYRAGVDDLVGVINGLSLTKRKLPEMDDSQAIALVINSFALLRGNGRSRQSNFFLSLEETTLRDSDLAAVLSSVSENRVDQLTNMVTGHNTEPLRAAEVEAALRGDQASALSQGAL